MAHIEAVQEDGSADYNYACAFSYLTDETKQEIQKLPSFFSVTTWMKNLAGEVHLHEFVDIFSLWKGQNI